MDIPSQPIKEWLKAYKSKNTRRSYQTGFRRFLEIIYGRNISKKFSDLTPTQREVKSSVVKEEYEKLARQYLKEDRNHYRDLKDFIIHLRDEENYAPNTQSKYLTSVKQFFIEYELEVGRLRWKKLQRMKEKSRIVMEDKRPTKDQLKKILLHLPLRGEALVLCLASSGMRRGELLKVTEDHVHFEETPTRIELEPEWCKKSHRGRTVFISHEASEKLKKWIEFKKGRFEKHGINKEKQREIRESDRIFPFTCSWANQIWKRGLEKAGLSQKDDKTGYLELHLHTLRKFFRTKMEAEIPQQTVEFLLGHKGYLSDSYRRLTIQEAGEG